MQRMLTLSTDLITFKALNNLLDSSSSVEISTPINIKINKNLLQSEDNKRVRIREILLNLIGDPVKGKMERSKTILDF